MKVQPPPGRRSGPPIPQKAATADTTSPTKFNRGEAQYAEADDPGTTG